MCTTGVASDGAETMIPSDAFDPSLIAPCGMDCALCRAHLREKDRCLGCNGPDTAKPRSCLACRIWQCDDRGAGDGTFCFARPTFPCARLRHLDKRYRANYRMSMIDNLERIREIGVDAFVGLEREKWRCPGCGAVVCVHKTDCLRCGRSTV